MLQAELRDISPNDFEGWEAFAQADHPEPWDEYGWFVLSIGLSGQEGTDLFQVLVATPRAVTRARGDDKDRRLLVVESFEPANLARALTDYVASVKAVTWDGIVEQLRHEMYWEYEKRWS
jgi:hypothetical protein